MTRSIGMEPDFVELIPPESELEEGKLYISMVYGTTVHLCASGCGRKVVLPLHPAQWRLLFDGLTVSLWPSVGNWDLPCRSHYWIRNNEIEWAKPWEQERIEAGRAHDAAALDRYYDETVDEYSDRFDDTDQPTSRQNPMVAWVLKWLGRRS